ncbi:MAG: DegT/DnrJ/EryC1/StrS family aminotransferase [Cylindrospermopsis raciborskii]|uniref:DegT/DnrJ/EryC1/StrS family aminotransferase n=1 Tax=Cylindrospermopsis raciborskii TaxID=77022 RepID=UPI003D1075BE
MLKPILLSTPHIGADEISFVQEAFETNWIAPVGPHIALFEQEFCQTVGIAHAAALASGTAALHIALRLVGVQPGDEVFCSTLTFIASVSPITYLGAKPVFIDSDRTSWNMDPGLLALELDRRSSSGNLPKAIILVHLYGQSADIDPILASCNKYNIPIIEDAAEALGATYKGKTPGVFGKIGIYSFNGNKIITTSGGGMLVSDDPEIVDQAKFLATQARDPAPHYQHTTIGYNYRLSNVLAGIGRGQLRVLGDRVQARRRNFAIYQEALSDIPGIEFMPEASFGTCTRWLTCITIEAEKFGCSREQLRLALAAKEIESRPVWKPMHLQPVFSGSNRIGGEVAEDIFDRGLCLPSGSNLTDSELNRVIDVIRYTHKNQHS